MTDINMPKLSDTMEEGTVVEWKKKTGDPVKKGEVIAEVESDKATFDLESEADGVLNILVEQGVPAKIGAPIARIGDTAPPAKPAPNEAPKAEKAPPPPPAAPKPAAEPARATNGSDGAATVGKAAPVRTPSPTPPRASGPEVEVVEPTRMQATIARRMAESKSTIPEFTVTVEARVDLA